MLKVTDAVRNRIQDGLKKYSRIVAQARQRGMNQQDTGDIVKAMLGDMLGYDPFFDVTAEISIRGMHADHAILLNGQLKLLLIIKAIGVTPHAVHLLRLSGTGAPPYAEWAVLTNGDIWSCYRLGVGMDRHPEPVFRVSLLDSRSIEEKTVAFLLLCKEGIEQDTLKQYWEHTKALNPGRLASLLLSDEVLNLLRRELLRKANFRAERQVLFDILTHHVIRPEALNADVQAEVLPRLAHCYAYVADPNDPNTWRLYYRSADGSPDPDRLMVAAAEIAGDPREINIPADDVPLVKQRLRQAYFELGISADELPASLRS